MSFTVGGSTPQLTFADATVQNTAALPLTGGSVSADITVNGLTVGRGAGAVSTNTAVGASALAGNTTGASNTAVGQNALNANTTGFNNTAVGYQAGNGTTTGSTNTFLGYQAGSNIITGLNNIYIGSTSSAVAQNVQSEIVIGVASAGKGNFTGYINAGGGGVYQGNNSSTWSTTSDQRLKKNIADNTDGLSKITAIRVRNFEYRLPEEVTELDSSCAVKNTGIQLGVIAQELQQVLPECIKTESTGVMSVNTDNLTWYLVNAIQELNAKVTALEAGAKV